MEQPKVYNMEKELIEWLIYDLEEQHRKELEYNKLVLNFGNNKIPINENIKLFIVDDDFTKYIKCLVNFNLILKNILKHFNIEEKYTKIENDFQYLICPFKVNITHCIFESTSMFCDIIFEGTVSFINTTFCDEVLFNTLKFIKSVYFDRVNFDYGKNVVFYDVIFKSEVDFLDLQWKNKLLFYDINSNLEFNLSTLNIIDTLEIIEFNKSKDDNLYSVINLDNISFDNSKSLLSIKDITNTIECISLKDIYMNGRINIQNVEVETVDFKGSVINGGLVNPVNFEVYKFENRESALFLKNEAYARNNIIDALKYKAKEFEMHKEELKRKNNKNHKDWGDIISIELSSLYSDNSLNWIKSFLYTILFSVLFFTMSYNISCIPIFIIASISFLYVLFYNKNISNRIFISAITYIIISIVFSFIYFEGYNNINYTIKELFSFIAPTNFSQILYDKGGLSYIYNSKNILEIIFKGIFYFLGKIAFWYGSVQTVQSFRKFSKKE